LCFIVFAAVVCKYAALVAFVTSYFPHQLPKKDFLLIGIDLYSDLEKRQTDYFRQHLMRPV
jgi:hypothetical protein